MDPEKRDHRLTLGIVIVASLIVGFAGGFVSGVASVEPARRALRELFTSETKADVGNTRVHTADGFSLTYPGNWTIDTAEDSYDPQHHLSLNSPGACYIQLTVDDDETSPTEEVEGYVREFLKPVVKRVQRSSFGSWGRYDGVGVELNGTINYLPGFIRVFSHQGPDGHFSFVQLCFDEDRGQTDPGFSLIEKSFTLRRGA